MELDLMELELGLVKLELGLMDRLDGPLLRVLDWCNNDQHLLIL